MLGGVNFLLAILLFLASPAPLGSLVCVSLQDADAKQASAAMRKALKSVDLVAWQQAFDQVLPFDDENIAKLVVQVRERAEEELTLWTRTRDELQEESARIIAGQEQVKSRTLQRPAHERFEELKKEISALRAKLDAGRVFVENVDTKLRRLRDEKAARYLLTKVVGDPKKSLQLKLAVVAALPGLGDQLVTEVGATLAKAKRNDDVLALLTGIQRLEDKARPLGKNLIALLAHNDDEVRVQAAIACASVRVPEAVPAMIALLGREKGQVRRRVSLALEDFTGKKLGVSKTSWEGWFAAEGKAWVAAGAPVIKEGGRGMFAASKKVEGEGVYYMGIPQDGEGIVYVIDASQSMEKLVKWRKPRDPSGGVTVAAPIGEDPNAGKGTTRLEACKQELIEALGRLERTKHFNVVWYSDVAEAWMPNLAKADPSKIAEAQAWVAKLRPIASTNIHDAMKLAFSIDDTASGQKGAAQKRGKKRGEGVDTIFLLTDGSPTTNDGQLDDPDKVLRAVRSWNPLGSIIVHTIGIGDGLNVDFLGKLAAENGGEFKHFDDSGRQK